MIRTQSLETLANHVHFARYTSAGTQMGLRKPTLINGVYVRPRCLGEAWTTTTIVRRDMGRLIAAGHSILTNPLGVQTRRSH